MVFVFILFFLRFNQQHLRKWIKRHRSLFMSAHIRTNFIDLPFRYGQIVSLDHFSLFLQNLSDFFVRTEINWLSSYSINSLNISVILKQHLNAFKVLIRHAEVKGRPPRRDLIDVNIVLLQKNLYYFWRVTFDCKLQSTIFFNSWYSWIGSFNQQKRDYF
jgi:hypothetical protein